MSDLTNLDNEALKRLLHSEYFAFTQGIDKGAAFETLKKIRSNIREITTELERRNVAAFPQMPTHPNPYSPDN